MKVFVHYKILAQTKPNIIETKKFTIAFSSNNVPKDRWAHHEAVKDYLIDTNPNPFEAIPDFYLLTVLVEV